MSLDISALASQMGAAILGVLKDKAPGIANYANSEGQKLAQSLSLIEAQYLSGQMSEEEAKLQLEIQKQAARAVLLAIEGLGLLAVEAAINAALNVVKDAVNTTLKFTLIP